MGISRTGELFELLTLWRGQDGHIEASWTECDDAGRLISKHRPATAAEAATFLTWRRSTPPLYLENITARPQPAAEVNREP